MERSLVDWERYGSMGKTNIVAYEVRAAIMGILQPRRFELPKVGGLHVVDSNPTRQGLVQTSSRQPDLDQFTGMVWYVAGKGIGVCPCLIRRT